MAGNGKVFVSHAHVDNALCDRYVQALRARGLDVWYDRQDMQAGHALTEVIERELQGRSNFVLILTPSSVNSFWVQMEIAAFRDLVARDRSRLILPVLASRDCEVPLLLRGLKWVDAVQMGFDAAIDEMARTLGAPAVAVGARPASPAASPASPSTPAIPPDRFPPRLAQLGYKGLILNGIEVILPPLCDVPAGSFLMGSDPRQDKDAQDDEQPQHWVNLPGFQIAKFPVTVAEYACFVRTGHAEPKSPNNQLSWQQQRERLDHPVVNVSWQDAVTYAAWLAQQTRQPWRLPNEAEWEKAARWDEATRTARIYPWGDTFDKGSANTSEASKKATTPVGAYPSGASPCGAHDMAGNVWEWTSSVYKSYPYSPNDGREVPNFIAGRARRGGSWGSNSGYAHAACRGSYLPASQNDFIGVRLARAVLTS